MNIQPPKNLLRPVGRAIAEYRMIQPNDRILLGLSGGKDSLTLLQILRHFQVHAPIHFELGVITVDPMVEGFDPSPLKAYLAALQIPYFYEQQPIMERAQSHMGKPSFCSWCSRMKRGAIYAVARSHGYNVIALAQHLDDLAESFLMSAFHGGRLKTMKANYVNDEGDLRIIRPMIYARERQTRDFALQAGLPVIMDNCPACYRMPTQRQHMKNLLEQEESENKGLFPSLLSAMRPLFSDNNVHNIR